MVEKSQVIVFGNPNMSEEEKKKIVETMDQTIDLFLASVEDEEGRR